MRQSGRQYDAMRAAPKYTYVIGVNMTVNLAINMTPMQRYKLVQI
jgi:hypothetical protein